MNNLPTVRQYIEIFSMQLYLNFPSMVSHISVIMLTYKDLALAYKYVWIIFEVGYYLILVFAKKCLTFDF